MLKQIEVIVKDHKRKTTPQHDKKIASIISKVSKPFSQCFRSIYFFDIHPSLHNFSLESTDGGKKYRVYNLKTS